MLALVRVAAHPGTELTASGDRVRIGKREIRLAAQIENDEHTDTKFLIGLRVDVFVDGQLQPLTYGSVGVGGDRQDAISTAVSEWAMAVGQALLGTFGVKVGEEPPQVGPFLIYQGPAGIRGSPGIRWPSESDKRLLHHLDPFIQGLERSPGELHSISLMVFVGRDGAVKGECRIDGATSPAVLKAMQSFPWRQGDSEYLFKQFYAIRRR